MTKSNQTIYCKHNKKTTYPALQESVHCDIAIIGGGLSGLSIAYELSNLGKNICLFEADTIARSNSGRNTGKLTLQQGLLYAKLIRDEGLEVAQHYVTTQQEALATIQGIIQEYEIDCDYETKDSVVYTTIEDEILDYEAEYVACVTLGLDVDLLDSLPIDANCKKGLILKNQGIYNPKKYCDGLAQVCQERKIRIFEETPIVAYHKEEHVVILDSALGISVMADQVVVATSFPCFDDGNLFFMRLPSLRSYIVAGKSKNPVFHSLDASYITTNKPTKSLRSYQGSLLICGGDHRVGLEVPNPFRDLKELGNMHYEVDSFDFEWAAQDYLTQDLLPYAGYLSPNTKRMFVLTGYNQWGNVNAMTCAMVLAHVMREVFHPLAAALDAQRVLPLLGVTFFQDNADMLSQLVQSKFQKKDKVPVAANTHALVKINGKTYGAYMNEENQLFIVDVLCTHMGCTLRFNDAEKTWDCPCHASRFHYDGRILSGPATQALHVFNDGYNTIDPHWFD